MMERKHPVVIHTLKIIQPVAQTSDNSNDFQSNLAYF